MTTAMLRQAVAVAAGSRRVLVLVASRVEVRRVSEELEGLAPLLTALISVRAYQDLIKGKLHGAQWDEVFVDHFVTTSWQREWGLEAGVRQ